MAWIAPIFFPPVRERTDSGLGPDTGRDAPDGRPEIPEGFEDVTLKDDASWTFVSEALDLVAYADRQVTAEGSSGRYALVDRAALKSLTQEDSVNKAAIVCSDDWQDILDAVEGFQVPIPGR